MNYRLRNGIIVEPVFEGKMLAPGENVGVASIPDKLNSSWMIGKKYTLLYGTDITNPLELHGGKLYGSGYDVIGVAP